MKNRRSQTRVPGDFGADYLAERGEYGKGIRPSDRNGNEWRRRFGSRRTSECICKTRSHGPQNRISLWKRHAKVKVAAVPETLNALHGHADQIFSDAITTVLHDAMEPEYL